MSELNEQRKKIIKFMDYLYNPENEEYCITINNRNHYLSAKELTFELNWNLLIEVIDKIESLEEGVFDVNILRKGTRITRHFVGTIINNVDNIFSFGNKIEHVYDAVCKFIDWYNSQTFAYVKEKSIYVTKNGKTDFLVNLVIYNEELFKIICNYINNDNLKELYDFLQNYTKCTSEEYEHITNCISKFFKDPNNLAKRDICLKQIEIQEKIQAAGFNIVNCCDCGSVVLVDSKENTVNCLCGEVNDPHDCSDFYYRGLENNEEFN